MQEEEERKERRQTDRQAPTAPGSSSPPDGDTSSAPRPARAGGTQAPAPSAGPAAGGEATEQPAAHPFESRGEVEAALAVWSGRPVGGATPEEGRRRGYKPPPTRSSARSTPANRGQGFDARRGDAAQRSRPGGASAETEGGDRVGRVKWFSMEKGYGFIEPDGGGEDVFVHLNQFRERPNEVRHGGRVAFRIGAGRHGKAEAKDVRPIA